LINISRILNKHRKEKAGGSPSQSESNKQQPPDSTPSEQVMSSAVNVNLEKNLNLDANLLYTSAFEKIKQVYSLAQQSKPESLVVFNPFLDKITDQLTGGKKDILRLALADYPKLDDFLYYHVLNVSVITLEIGIGLGYNRATLIELGKGAYLHDIGLIRFPDLLLKPEQLSVKEQATVKQHSEIGSEILKTIDKNISRKILDVVEQEHMRLATPGYAPVKGIEDYLSFWKQKISSALQENIVSDRHISEYAQIVGLADVYEAMTHKRPYRAKFSPFETIHGILENKHAFDYNILKTLIQRMGIFPVGTLVRLNSKEIGVVMEEISGHPFSPIINIIFDSNAKELQIPKVVNLAENSEIYIEDCVNV